MDTPAVARLRELLRIPTVSTQAGVDPAVFAQFREALARLYPRVHALGPELVADHSLLVRWPGRTSTDPLVLMAHYDVVPVVPEEWTHPPFEAVIAGDDEAEATLYARGAIDDKGALVAIVEAVEELLAEGFVPERDVYLAFGHDEEVAGVGAPAIVDVLARRGIRPSLVLDEGGAVVRGVIPGVAVETAMVGVAERGVMTLRLTAREQGGHASTPPRRPATARLARAVHRLQRRPFPVRIAPPVRAMFATLAPHTEGPLAAVYRRIGVTGRVLARILPSFGPETNAIVRTTAVVTELTGADGENVLATAARASVNIRLLTGDTVAGALARVRRVIADPEVEVELRHGSDPSPVSPWRGEAWRRVAAAVTSTLGAEVVVTPYLQLGASDSRWFTAISDHVYRFTPFRLDRAERDALHAHDERIRVEVWLRGITFYRDLLRRS